MTSLKATNLLSFAETSTIDLSFGQCVFAVGANGSGKTNVLRLIEIFRAWATTGPTSYVLPQAYRFDPAKDASLGVTFQATAPVSQLWSAFEFDLHPNSPTPSPSATPSPTNSPTSAPFNTPSPTNSPTQSPTNTPSHRTLTVTINLSFTAQATILASTPTFKPDCRSVLYTELFLPVAVQATVVLRADDGLLATTRFLLDVDDRYHIDSSPISLVRLATTDAFPAITLLRVLDDLRRGLASLQAINELMGEFFGTGFVMQDNELLHQYPGGPARPLELAPDGIIHALLLFHALSANAQSFFFDEPASKLHPSCHNKLRHILTTLAGRGKSVFVITHAPSMIDPEIDTLLHFSATRDNGTRVQPLKMIKNQVDHLHTMVGRAHLFCRFVVFVEGKLDFNFLSALQRAAPSTSELGRILHSTHLTPVSGKGNLATAMYPFRCIPTPWICLCDADCLDEVDRSDPRVDITDKLKERELQFLHDCAQTVKNRSVYLKGFFDKLPTLKYDGDGRTARAKLERKLRRSLAAIQDHSEVQQVLREFARERCRTYVWASRGNGALEAALAINKGEALQADPAYWDHLARQVLAAWDRHRAKVDQPTENSEEREEREDVGERYGDVIGFLEYLVRRWSEPYAWWEVRHPGSAQ